MLPRRGGAGEQDPGARRALEWAEGGRLLLLPRSLRIFLLRAFSFRCFFFFRLRVRLIFFFLLFFSFPVEPRRELGAEGGGGEVGRRARGAQGRGGQRSNNGSGSRPLALPAATVAAAAAVVAAAVTVVAAPAVLKVVLGEVLEPPARGQEVVGAVVEIFC